VVHVLNALLDKKNTFLRFNATVLNFHDTNIDQSFLDLLWKI